MCVRERERERERERGGNLPELLRWFSDLTEKIWLPVFPEELDCAVCLAQNEVCMRYYNLFWRA